MKEGASYSYINELARTGAESLIDILDGQSRGSSELRDKMLAIFASKNGLTALSNARTKEDIRNSVVVSTMRERVEELKAKAAKQNDVAKRQLHMLASLITTARDTEEMVLKQKHIATGIRRASLWDAVQGHKRGDECEWRTKKRERADKKDLKSLCEALWHIVCPEKKGKGRRCLVRRSGKKEAELHRIRHEPGTMLDAYNLALATPLHQSWAETTGDKLTRTRFARNMCFCVRTRGREFCICWIHDGFAEFMKHAVVVYPQWHADLAGGVCDCTRNPNSVSLPSSSFYDVTMALTCGLADEFVVNSIAHIAFQPWKCLCIIHECPNCKDKFLNCPAGRDTERKATWRAHKHMPKLKKGQVLDEKTGLLTDGTRPKKSRELASVSGTRHQFISAFRDHWIRCKTHNYESRWDGMASRSVFKCMRRQDFIMESDFAAHPCLRPSKELTCQEGVRVSPFTAIVTFGTSFDGDGCATRCVEH